MGHLTLDELATVRVLAERGNIRLEQERIDWAVYRPSSSWTVISSSSPIPSARRTVSLSGTR